MKTLQVVGLATVLAVAGGPVGFAAEMNPLDNDVRDAVQIFKQTDSKIQKLLDTAQGYVVFPAVTKGAVGVGAAHDRGQVFEKGQLIGTAELTQVTIGAQLGGQQYAELILFETKETLDAFKASEWTMAAEASAVAAAEGAAANAKYHLGVLVFTIVKGGLMFEASVGGQKFHYTPVSMPMK